MISTNCQHRSERKRVKKNTSKQNKNVITIVTESDVTGVNETKANINGKSGQKS